MSLSKDEDVVSTPHTTVEGELPQEARGIKLTKRQATKIAWMRGLLKWKLDPNQKTLYDKIFSAPRKRYYLNCGRRVGKSYLLGVIAIEFCLKNPGAIVKVAAPTAKMVRQFVLPIYRDILKDCPEHIRPTFTAMDGEWRFKNGSVISIAGCDTMENAESLRGPSCDIFMFDEAGFINNLEYIRRNIVAPMLMTTGGRIIFASTPAVSPAHDSIGIFYELKKLGCAETRTIFDNPRLTAAQIHEFLSEESGILTVDQFKETVTFRREYLAEIIPDSTRAVVPEFDAKKEAELVQKFEYTSGDMYSSIDIGFRDGMGMLFGHFDFRAQKLFIRAEELLFRSTTRQVADAMKTAEKAHYGDLKPYLRVSDDDLLFIHDMGNEHGITLVPTAKDNKHLQVDNLRRWITGGKIIIHPDCKNLIHQLHTTIWNKSYDSYERNKDGHGDLVDALVYLVRNVRRHRRGMPTPEELELGPNVVVNPYLQDSKTPAINKLAGLFKTRVGFA